MSKISIVSQHYTPEIGAASNRVQHVVKHLAMQGEEIFLVTTQPNYPNFTLYAKEKYYVSDYNNQVHIYRTPVIRLSKDSKENRLLNQLIFLILSIFVLTYIRYRYKVKKVVTTSPPFLLNFVGLFACTFLRMTWFLEVRDLWPDSAVAVGVLTKKSKIYKVLKKIELICYDRCDKIIVVTTQTKKKLIASGISNNKINVITNGVPDWTYNYDKPITFAEKQSWNVLYAGNLGLAQDLHILLEVANELQEKPIQFYFVGDGIAKNELYNLAKELKLKNVHFVPAATSKSELASWYQGADLSVVCLKEETLFTSVIPSKIFEYGAFGIPILYIGQGEGRDIVEEYSLGIGISWNINEISEMVIQITEEYPSITHQLMKNKERFMQDYSWGRLASLYLEILK